MSNTARSVFIYGLYLIALGIILLLIPNFLLRTFFLPSTTEVWIRVVGMLILFLGFYYTLAARKEMIDFFKWTIYFRPTTILFFTAFVLLGFTSPFLILFGVVDLAGALWTAVALRTRKIALAKN